QLRAALAESSLAPASHRGRHCRTVRRPLPVVVRIARQTPSDPSLDGPGLCRWYLSGRRGGLLSVVFLSATKFRRGAFRTRRGLVGLGGNGSPGHQALSDRHTQGPEEPALR